MRTMLPSRMSISKQYRSSHVRNCTCLGHSPNSGRIQTEASREYRARTFIYDGFAMNRTPKHAQLSIYIHTLTTTHQPLISSHLTSPLHLDEDEECELDALLDDGNAPTLNPFFTSALSLSPSTTLSHQEHQLLSFPETSRSKY